MFSYPSMRGIVLVPIGNHFAFSSTDKDYFLIVIQNPSDWKRRNSCPTHHSLCLSFIFKQPNISLCHEIKRTCSPEAFYALAISGSHGRTLHRVAVNLSAGKFLFPCFSIPVLPPLYDCCMLCHCVYFRGILAHGEKCTPAKIPLAEAGNIKLDQCIHVCKGHSTQQRERPQHIF